MIRLYNTLTRKKEILQPVEEGKIGLYACGPTVYDYFHIGNARVFIFFDVLRRHLSYRGYKVTFVQNYTDIDDKMINRAAEMGITVDGLAEKFIRCYKEDAAALHIEPPDYEPRATEYIPQIIALIQKLIEKGHAYELDGDVYYDVESFPDYGKLSHQDLDELALGVRVELDERKRHPMDFVLWKKEKPGEPSWDSPWGKGRPGWHIECSAMSMHFLGETLDIHAGGRDLIFPHHENEIAQSEGTTGREFARYWLHAGYLNIDSQKMSKSLGNVFTVRGLRQKYDPRVLRFFMLSAHYRSPMNFSEELLQQAASALERLNNAVFNLQDCLKKSHDGPPDDEEKALLQFLEESREKFIQSMDDDINTADAIAALFELARSTNSYVNRSHSQSSEVVEKLVQFFQEADSILGFLDTRQPEELEGEIEELIARREEARREKNFALADAIRDQLRERGIILEDTPQGVRWKVVAEEPK